MRGSSKSCFNFGRFKPILEGYTDTDMVGDLDGRKSIAGYLFTFAGGAVSWQSKLQKCVALSTTEAEYIVVNEAGKEMLWMKWFLQELGLMQDKYIVHCDSQSAIDLSKNAIFQSPLKHIEVRYHWIRLVVEKWLMQLRKIHTKKNPADMLTKVVTKEKLKLCVGTADMNSNWRVGMKIFFLNGLEGEIVGRCTTPWSLAHIGLVFEHWRNPISYRNRCTNCTRSQKLLFLIELGVSGDRALYIKLSTWVSWIVREIQRETEEWNTILKPTKGKRLVFCAALREKIKGDFSFAQDTQGR